MPTLPSLRRLPRRPRPELGHAADAPAGRVHARPATGSTDVAIQRPETDRFEPAVAVVRTAVAGGLVPAAVLGIRHGSAPARVEVVGRERGDRVTRDSIFFLASVTKPVLATAVMQLVEEGRIDLDRPIVEDLPEFAGADRKQVTPRHLLSHTAGIDDAATGTLTRSRPSARALFLLACRMPLRFEPGTRFEYSSVSFFLLGELVARRAGMPYPAFISERILTPLGMGDTAFDPRTMGRGRLMAVHGAALDSWWKRRLALGYLASIAHPGGGLWGTADDVLRFGDAMLDAWHGRPGAILRRETIREMTRIQTASAPPMEAPGAEDPVGAVANYALGWWKPGDAGTVPASADAFEHGGASGTRLLVDPRYDLVAVYLSNEWKQPPDLVCWPAMRAIYGALDAT
jgi:CubicO group peptidase (beta-lactamase class C family)